MLRGVYDDVNTEIKQEEKTTNLQTQSALTLTEKHELAANTFGDTGSNPALVFLPNTFGERTPVKAPGCEYVHPLLPKKTRCEQATL